jgi:phosphatidylglycerophosphate synthase
LDCADGQVARASKTSTEFGALLDVAVDVVTQLAQAFAILYWLGGVLGSLDIQIVVAIVSLSAGRVLVVITGKYTSHHRHTEKAGMSKSKIKFFLLGILDTPVLLACFALLRDYPSILIWYVFFMGVAYSANSFYLAWTRLYLRVDRPS